MPKNFDNFSPILRPLQDEGDQMQNPHSSLFKNLTLMAKAVTGSSVSPCRSSLPWKKMQLHRKCSWDTACSRSPPLWRTKSQTCDAHGRDSQPERRWSAPTAVRTRHSTQRWKWQQSRKCQAQRAERQRIFFKQTLKIKKMMMNFRGESP